LANITRSWKRFLAVGCSHGFLADQAILREVLRFKARWKPHTTIHLGDAIDLACLRAGALGTADDSVDPDHDLQMGVAFLRQLEPQAFCLGNHEHRLISLMDSPRALVASLAGRVYQDIESETRRLRAKLLPYDLKRGWLPLGSALFGHGYFCNSEAVRDHAETVCNGTHTQVVIAHLHRVMQAEGRRLDAPTGYCVGTLMDISQAHYAANRRATTSWSRGFAWGEYTTDETQIWLAKETKGGAFRLPV